MTPPKRLLYALTTILACVASALGNDQATADTPIDFARDIRPILSNKCFACHGPDEEARQASLRLDREEDARQGGDSGAAVVPKNLDKSLLWQRITSEDEDERMPPVDEGKPLTKEEVAKLRQWIEQGAPWSRHWAYEPPRRHKAPKVGHRQWPSNDIDRFLLADMEAAGIEPSPDADPVTLLRRLSFDLRGLPPSPQEIAEFLADPSPEAWEKWVDRFLASPAYGERLAIYWLDLVRYADTVGYHGDQGHAISPYRDWVIDALNDDMPFDDFTRYQLAGDLLPNPTLESYIASGYNRLLQTSHEGGVQPKEYLAIYQADRVRNLSEVWLGGTMGCAQCHDHKYDPFTMKDFYSMAAFFADLDEARHFRNGTNALVSLREPEIVVLSRSQRQALRALRREWMRLNQESSDAKARTRRLEIEQQIRQLEQQARRTMISVAIAPRTVRLLPRGNWLDDSGPIMQPAVPEFLGSLNTNGRRATRLDLANWLVDVDQGVGLLTARVMANRLFYLCFGEGLARVLDDFGGQGEPPDHPALLDHLAIQLVQNDWKLKPTIKTIVMSHAYRMTSEATPDQLARDPENRLVSHQNSFRLPAEMIRDQMLAASGLLVRTIGGPSAKPYQPAGYYRHLNFPTRKYVADRDENQWRRGVYVHWQRQYLHPMLKAFDAPSREECTAKRPRSNTPIAALVLLNDPSSIEAAKMLAARVLIEKPAAGDDERLEAAAAWVISRKLLAPELAILQKVLDESRNEFETHPDAAAQLVAVGLAKPNVAVSTPEWAAWTEVARTLFNLGAATTRY